MTSIIYNTKVPNDGLALIHQTIHSKEPPEDAAEMPSSAPDDHVSE